MTASNNILTTGKAAQTRKRRALFLRAMRMLDQWGFEEVEVPLLAPWDELRSAIGEDIQKELFRFPGRFGELRVLRGDVTPMIAWQYANHLQRQPLPVRLAYAKRIARVQREFARERTESYQLGAELIGQTGPHADVEILTVLFDLLDELQLNDGEVRIGHVGIAEHIVRSATEDPQVQEHLFAAIDRRDRFEVDYWTDRLHLSEDIKSAFRRLCAIVPDFYDLERLSALGNPGVQKSVAELTRVTELLEELGYRDRVMLDLSRRNDRGYYTGVVFQVVAERADVPLGGGGRYDKLIGRFGEDYPAVGFGLNADLLVDLVDDLNGEDQAPDYKKFDGTNIAAALQQARLARKNGENVRIQHNRKEG